METVFEYDALQHDDSLRILRLHPPRSQDPRTLYAELIHHRLSESPDYEAISYAWGKPVFPETLVLPTGHLKITSNLAAALRQFRRNDAPRDLWADAVCINQHDLQEKSAQVARMSSIFKSAHWVLAWLGESDEQSASIIATLKRIAWTTRRRASEDPSLDLTDPVRSFDTLLIEGSPLHNLITTVDFQSVVNFLGQRAWFRRRWVLQEAALARRFIFCCGSSLLTLSHFSLALTVINQFLNGSHSSLPTRDAILTAEKIGTGIRRLLTISGVRAIHRAEPDEAKDSSSTWRHERYQDMALVGQRAENAARSGTGPRCTGATYLTILDCVWKGPIECSNERDQIYALLGLNDDDRFLMTPDYTKPVETIYTDFAKACLRCHDMRLLHFAGPQHFRVAPGFLRISEEEMHSALPSWVPNWNPKSIRSTLFHNAFHAGIGLEVRVAIDDLGSILEVSGILLDTVGETKQFTHVPGRRQAIELRYACKILLSSLLEVKAFYDEHSKGTLYFDGEDNLSAFARTIILDCSDDGDKRTLKATDTQPPFTDLWKLFESIRSRACGSTDVDLRSALQQSQAEQPAGPPFDIEMAQRHLHVLQYNLFGHAFFITSNYRCIGLGTETLCEGDQIVLIGGLSTPLILRPVPGIDAFRVVGGCYLHGFMYGEIMGAPHQRMRQSQGTIKII